MRTDEIAPHHAVRKSEELPMPSQCSADLRHLASRRKQPKFGSKLEVWEAANPANNRL